MRIRHLQSLWLLVASCALAQPAPDALDIVRQSVARDQHNWILATNYVYTQRAERRDVDGRGQVKSTDVKTYEITFLYDEPYRKLIARDDKPLSSEDQSKEEAKLEKVMAARKAESPAQRLKRLSKLQQRRERQHTLVREIPEAYNLRLAGEERVHGHDCWVVEGTPRAEFRPETAEMRLLSKLKIKLWIAKADYAWVRATADLIDSVTYGLFLARLDKGSHMEFEQAWVNNEVWLPSRQFVSYSGRLGLFGTGGQQENTFSNYRRFQTEAHIVDIPGKPTDPPPDKKPMKQ